MHERVLQELCGFGTLHKVRSIKAHVLSCLPWFKWTTTDDEVVLELNEVEWKVVLALSFAEWARATCGFYVVS